MIKCSFPTDTLIMFLKRRSENMNAEMTPELKKHIKTCATCKKLLQDNDFARAFLKFDTRLNQSPALETAGQITTFTIIPGQIIEFCFAESETAFATVTSEPFAAHENIPESVRIAPFTLAPHPEEISARDIIISSEISGLQTPALIEIWNERPILISQIRKTIKTLPQNCYKKVIENIQNPPVEEILSNRIRTFRKSRLQLGDKYSGDVFKKLGELETTFGDAPAFASAIKVVFKRVKKVLCSFDFHFNYLFEVSEPIAVFNSASDCPDSEYAEDFYSLMFDILKANSDLPFRLRLKENTVTLLNTEGRKFSFEIQLKNSQNIIFSSSAERLKLKGSDLQPIHQKAIESIIFEEY